MYGFYRGMSIATVPATTIASAGMQAMRDGAMAGLSG
jgi:hypothetical protein